MYARDPGDGAGEAPGELDQMLNAAAVEAARYICRRLPGVPKTSFVKYLYLTDREYASRHGHALLGTRWWRETQGPLSSAVTKMIRGAEFRVEESMSPSGNSRVGHVEADETPLLHLGAAEIAVLDTVLAEFGQLGQVELLDRVHALPEVKAARLKEEIALPTDAPDRGTADYVASLLTELAREQKAAIYDVELDEDEVEHAKRLVEARSAVRTLI